MSSNEHVYVFWRSCIKSGDSMIVLVMFHTAYACKKHFQNYSQAMKFKVVV